MNKIVNVLKLFIPVPQVYTLSNDVLLKWYKNEKGTQWVQTIG